MSVIKSHHQPLQMRRRSRHNQEVEDLVRISPDVERARRDPFGEPDLSASDLVSLRN